MKHGNQQVLSLTDLEEGVYSFKVVVRGTEPEAFGETIANVTVLPGKVWLNCLR